MPGSTSGARRAYHLFLLLGLVLLTAAVWFWPTRPGSWAGELAPVRARPVAVAPGKGQFVSTQGIRLTPLERLAQSVALADPAIVGLATGRLQFLAADALDFNHLPLDVLDSCRLEACSHVTFYDYAEGGTVEAVVNLDQGVMLTSWRDPLARPRATVHVLNQALAIAADDQRVEARMGSLRDVPVAMVPMSIWLVDDDCRVDWCVDLTFASPDGDGRILHITVNMQQSRVARLFYTRARDERPLLQSDELDENAPLYTDGCHEQFAWQICWSMTAHDGLEVFGASYQGRLIFSSLKIAQVEVYYSAWPGGYRDEVGFNSSVPPKFDTRITELEDGFELRQMFTEEFDWPNCVCCYRYEQVIQFYSDGSFTTEFVSHGPGCDDLSVYRPFWRLDLDLDADEATRAYAWNGSEWTELNQETELDLFGPTTPDGQLLATFADNGLHYRWVPEPTDPLGLDEGRLFVVQGRPEEGAGPIEAGPADTLMPPRQWMNDEQASGANVVLWYIPFLKTKKAEPWYCMPEPAPDFSPCNARLRAVPGRPLDDPAEVATREAQLAEQAATPTPRPTLTPAPTPTPKPIPGTTAVAIIQNAGCGVCHVIGSLGEAGKVGPDLSNIGNSAGTRVAGMSAADYLRQSILAPNAFIAPACPNGACLANIMQAYENRLTPAQVDTLVSFLLDQKDDDPLAAAPSVRPGEATVVGTEPETGPPAEAGSVAPPANSGAVGVVAAGVGLLLFLAALGVWLGRRARERGVLAPGAEGLAPGVEGLAPGAEGLAPGAEGLAPGAEEEE